MGWSNSSLLSAIVNSDALGALAYPYQKQFYAELIELFAAEDFDVFDEVESDRMAWTAAYRDYGHKRGWFEDE